MRHVQLAEAKAKLSGLLAAVEAGETVASMRRGRVVARLVPEAQIVNYGDGNLNWSVWMPLAEPATPWKTGWTALRLSTLRCACPPYAALVHLTLRLSALRFVCPRYAWFVRPRLRLSALGFVCPSSGRKACLSGAQRGSPGETGREYGSGATGWPGQPNGRGGPSPFGAPRHPDSAPVISHRISSTAL